MPSTDLPRLLARDLDRHFDDVVRTFQQPLFAYAYRISGCPQDAQEVVQDVFIRAYRALAGYPPERIRAIALKAWLYRICVNQVRNKRRRHRLATTELHDESIGSPGGDDPTADGYAAREGGAEMQSLVSMLPSTYRTSVVLRYVNDLSYPEIAEILGQPQGTVKSNVHRGLKLLRDYVVSADVTSGPGRPAGPGPAATDEASHATTESSRSQLTTHTSEVDHSTASPIAASSGDQS